MPSIYFVISNHLSSRYEIESFYEFEKALKYIGYEYKKKILNELTEKEFCSIKKESSILNKKLVIPGLTSYKNRPSKLYLKTLSDIVNTEITVIGLNKSCFDFAACEQLKNYEFTCSPIYAKEFKSLYPELIFKEDAPFTINDNVKMGASGFRILEILANDIAEELNEEEQNELSRILNINISKELMLPNEIFSEGKKFNDAITWAKNNIQSIENIDILARKILLISSQFLSAI